VGPAIEKVAAASDSLSKEELQNVLIEAGLPRPDVPTLVSAEAFKALDLSKCGKVDKVMLLDSLQTFGGAAVPGGPRCLSPTQKRPSEEEGAENGEKAPNREIRSAMHALHLMYNSGCLPQDLISKPKNEMKIAFEAFDTSGDGFIDFRELSLGLDRLGAGLSKKEVSDLWMVLARGGDGPHRLAKGIKYEYFAAALSKYKVFEAAVKQIVDALRNGGRSLYGVALKNLEDVFTAIDEGMGHQRAKGDGGVTLNEFVDGMTRLGVVMSARELAQVYHAIDVDGSGIIDVNEFCSAIRVTDDARRARERSRRSWQKPLPLAFKVDLAKRNSKATFIAEKAAAKKKREVLGKSVRIFKMLFETGKARSELLSKSKNTYREAFNCIDIDSSGELDVSELKTALTTLGFEVSDEDVKDLFDAMNTRGAGTGVNYESFSVAMSNYKAFAASVKQIADAMKSGFRQLHGKKLSTVRDVFAALDKDGGGSICWKEFYKGMRRLGVSIGEGALIHIFKSLDLDGSATLDIEELSGAIEMHGQGFSRRQQKQLLRSFSPQTVGHPTPPSSPPLRAQRPQSARPAPRDETSPTRTWHEERGWVDSPREASPWWNRTENESQSRMAELLRRKCALEAEQVQLAPKKYRAHAGKVPDWLVEELEEEVASSFESGPVSESNRSRMPIDRFVAALQRARHDPRSQNDVSQDKVTTFLAQCRVSDEAVWYPTPRPPPNLPQGRRRPQSASPKVPTPVADLGELPPVPPAPVPPAPAPEEEEKT